MTEAALVIALCALVYRVARGSGLLENLYGRLAWVNAVGYSCLLLGAPALVAALAGAGAYAGQLISHSKVFQMHDGNKSIGPWFAVCFTRAALITAPLGLAFLPLALAGVGCVAANLTGKFGGERGYFSDMLVVGELLQGAVFGFLIVTAVRGLQ